MPALLDTLSSQLGPGLVNQISSRLGTDSSQTQTAIATALPLLIGGLAKNANQSQSQAQALSSALDNDHDGSLLDNLGSLLGGGAGGGLAGALGSALGGGGSRATDGDGILGHILGGKRSAVEQGVSRASGLDASKVGPLLAMLAPVVMGALGKVKRQQNMNTDEVAATLNRERAQVEEETEGMQQGGLLSMLDSDQDGSIADDIAKMGAAFGGAALLGKMFGKK